MMEKPRYQIFISSTYEDMKEERQAAMMAILGKKHIPAGMEYFSARYLSQFDVIKEWIENCDIFLLILGGRYGSICDKTKKSFVHMEFEYAQSLGMPIIVLIAEDQYVMQKKAKAYKNGDQIYDHDRADLYDRMTAEITNTKMRKTYDGIDCLQMEIMRAIDDIETDKKILSRLNGLVPSHPEMKKNSNEIVMQKGILKELLCGFLHSAVFLTHSEKMLTGRGYYLSDVEELATGQWDYFNHEELLVEYQRVRIWPHAVEEKHQVRYIADRSGNSDFVEETLRFRFQGYSDSFQFTSRQAVWREDEDHCVTNLKEMSINYLDIMIDAMIDEEGKV